MKRIILCYLIVISVIPIACGQNTFPQNGDVGINTMTPSAKLDVNGHMKIDSSLLIKDSVVVNKNMRVGEDSKIGGDLYVGGNALFNGNIGIRGDMTIESMEDLTVQEDRILIVDAHGEVKTRELTDITAYTYGSTCFPFEGANGTFYLAPAWQSEGGPNINDPKLYTGVDCPARVGIGTDEPNSTIDVRGDAFINEKITVGGINGNAYSAYFTIDMENNTNSSDPVYIRYPNGSPLFKINKEGTIGINTFAPEYNLHIVSDENSNIEPLLIENGNDELMKLGHNGLLYVREVKVTLNAFPDYVFDSTYTLMTIEEVEAYIEEHGHLPDMPPAEEVDENGIGVGDLQIKQQKKIEELTTKHQ